ncbi:MAG: hypothetical protein LBJ98_05205, partial [Endomicrobium sp.]|nr:hypothetical protein [Endomicrobium sp.]
MKKLLLLYEASLLMHKDKKDKKDGRTGIFFVAYNVLEYLSQNTHLDIILYISKNHVKDMRKDRLLSKFQFIAKNISSESSSRFLKNIEVHKKSKIQTSSNYKKVILNLKILKNHFFFLINNREKKRNESLLQSIDVFLSPVYMPDAEISQHKNILQFIILYDTIPLIYPEFFPNLENHWFTKLINSLNKDTYYFCISENTKRDFLKLFSEKLDKGKMITMPIATAQDFFPEHDVKKLVKTFLKYGINYISSAKY